MVIDGVGNVVDGIVGVAFIAVGSAGVTLGNSVLVSVFDRVLVLIVMLAGLHQYSTALSKRHAYLDAIQIYLSFSDF